LREPDRFVGVYSLAPVTVGALLEMKPNFLFEVAVQTSPLEERPATKAEIG
jgi:hypothetical protein